MFYVFPTTSRSSQNRSQQASRRDTATVSRLLWRAATLLAHDVVVVAVDSLWGEKPLMAKKKKFFLALLRKSFIPAELAFHNKSWIFLIWSSSSLFWCSTKHSEATRKIWRLLPQNCPWISNSAHTRGTSAQTTCTICSLNKPRSFQTGGRNTGGQRRVKLVKNSHGYSSETATFFSSQVEPSQKSIWYISNIHLGQRSLKNISKVEAPFFFFKHITWKVNILSVKFKPDQSAFTSLPAEWGSNICRRQQEQRTYLWCQFFALLLIGKMVQVS